MRGRQVVIVVALFGSGRAFAQKSVADAEFKHGKELMAAGKIAEACEAFDKSQAADASIATMLNLGNCREKNDQLATALSVYKAAAAQTMRGSDTKAVQYNAIATERAAKLGERVSSVTVDVPVSARVPGLTVKRGSDVIDPSQWGTAILLDGGAYVFDVSAPGYKTRSFSIALAPEKDRKRLEVVALELEVTVQPPVDTKPVDTKPVDTKPVDIKPVGTKPVTTPVRPPIAAPRRSRLVPYSIGGAGVALEITSIGLVAWAYSMYGDAKVTGNDDEQLRLWNGANTRLYLAQGLGIAGLGCIGVSVFMVLRSGSQGPPEHGVQLVPQVGGDRASLVVSGRF